VPTADLRRRSASSAVAGPPTVRPDGAPHVVPVVFARIDGTAAVVEDPAAFGTLLVVPVERWSGWSSTS
jgi:hypothetical protein